MDKLNFKLFFEATGVTAFTQNKDNLSNIILDRRKMDDIAGYFGDKADPMWERFLSFGLTSIGQTFSNALTAGYSGASPMPTARISFKGDKENELTTDKSKFLIYRISINKINDNDFYENFMKIIKKHDLKLYTFIIKIIEKYKNQNIEELYNNDAKFRDYLIQIINLFGVDDENLRRSLIGFDQIVKKRNRKILNIFKTQILNYTINLEGMNFGLNNINQNYQMNKNLIKELDIYLERNLLTEARNVMSQDNEIQQSLENAMNKGIILKHNIKTLNLENGGLYPSKRCLEKMFYNPLIRFAYYVRIYQKLEMQDSLNVNAKLSGNNYNRYDEE